jgi:hypothetical protein
VQRLRKVRDGYDAALKAQHPESTKLRALMGFSSEKAAAKEFAAAGKALDMIDKLLKDGPAPRAEAGPGPGAARTAASGTTPARAAGSASSVEPPPSAEVARLAAGAAGAARLANAVRPKAAPRAALSRKLVTDIAAQPLPARVADLPAQVAASVPAFLISMVSEAPQSSQPLQAGATVETQDQMLGVADSLNAVLRSMRKWEQFLARGEDLARRLDQLDRRKAAGDDEAEVEAEVALAAYNTARSAGLREQARAQQLLQGLMREYEALQREAAPA